MTEAADIVLYLYAFIAFIVVAVVLVFLWNLWLAPYRLMEERLDKAVSDGNVLVDIRQNLEPASVDVSLWDGASGFKLGDAACLWVEISPHEPISNDAAKATFARLSAAMMQGRIPYPISGINSWLHTFESGRKWPAHDQWISAIDLRKYADSIGQVPLFLQSVDVPDAQKLLEQEEENETKEA